MGVGRIDASGRVGDRAFTSALGWRPGRPADSHRRGTAAVIARRDPAGLVAMPAKPYIMIPVGAAPPLRTAAR